ncbi:metal ABC transporter permease, partial [Yersinia enterocolitica]|nr:metal ABC transporter permease [Yersinia enterocolitica]
QMLVVATVVSVVACVLGTLISFHIDGATGPCIVIIQALFFVIALIYNRISPKIIRVAGRRPGDNPDELT